MINYRVCPICGQEFSYTSRTPNKKYCSRVCYSESKKTGIYKFCETCGNEFYAPNARSKARYCSWNCRDLKVEKACRFCGKTFLIKPSHYDKRLTCSRSCASRLRGKEKRSPNQGKRRKLSARLNVSEGLKRYYKKNPTAHWNYRGGTYTDFRGTWNLWQEQRRLARQRDNFTCQFCKTHEDDYGKQLSVHHIKRFVEFDNWQEANDLSNLICLCQSCHMKIEHGSIKL